MRGATDSALKCGAARRRFARAILLKTSIAAGVLLLFAGSAWSADAPIRDFTTYMPTAKATRIDASEAPVIDGDVSDPVWMKAEPITEFYQTDPNPGQPASAR